MAPCPGCSTAGGVVDGIDFNTLEIAAHEHGHFLMVCIEHGFVTFYFPPYFKTVAVNL